MAIELNTFLLEDCMDAIIDYRGKTPTKSSSGIPLVTARVIKDGRFLPFTEFIEESEYDKWMRRGIPRPGDIVLTTEAPLGEVAQLGNQKIALAQRVITLRGKDRVLDNTFLKYLLLTDQFKHQLDGRATGTTVTGIKQSELRKLTLTLPSFQIQKSIAHILGTLDDKIELNRGMNETLEGMAQALFRSWFVDFDPVIDNALAAGHTIPEPLQRRAAARQKLSHQQPSLPNDLKQLFPDRFYETNELGWVPVGWEVRQLGEFLQVKRGGSPRPIHDFLDTTGLPWVKISDATAASSRFLIETKEFIKPHGLNKTVMLKAGELILSNSATPGLPMFLALDACIHDGWLYFPEKRLFSDMYLYQLFLVVRSQLLMQGNGSVFTNLKTDILRDHKAVVPTQELISSFDRFALDFNTRLHDLEKERRYLAQLRDTLLPRLLSGKLRIPNAEKLVAEVV